MQTQRFKKISCFGQNLFIYLDLQQGKIRLMQPFAIFNDQNQPVIREIKKLKSYNHSNIVQIKEIFQSIQQSQIQLDQMEIHLERRRFIYVQIKKTIAGPLKQFFKELKKDQAIQIYKKLQETLEQLHKIDFNIQIYTQNIFVDDSLNPIICPSMTSIYKIAKYKKQSTNSSQKNLHVQEQKKKKRIEQLNIVFYELILEKPVRQQLQRSDFKSKKEIMSYIDVIIENYLKNQIKEKNKKTNVPPKKKQSPATNIRNQIQMDNNQIECQSEQLEGSSDIKINTGPWNNLEKERFYKFLIKHENLIKNDKFTLSKDFYTDMAKYIKTRTPKQCKNCYYRIKGNSQSFDKFKQNANLYANNKE